MPKKNVLIIGGTSSIVPEIIKQLEDQGYSIDLMTYRQKDKIYGDHNWTYLNLEEESSVLNFIEKMPIDHYSKIIFVSGNSLGNYKSDIPYDVLKQFYDSFLLRYNLIINESTKSLCDDGQIISISSIAANRPIPDANYSAVKAGVQAFVRSLSCSLKPNQSAFSIAPGMIYKTRAFDEMNYEGDISKFCTPEQIASVIASADKSYNGRVIELGY